MTKAFVLCLGILPALVLLAACGSAAETATVVPASVPTASAVAESTATSVPAATNTTAATTAAPAGQAGCTAGATPDAAVAGKPLTKVVVAMGYIANVQFAPFYVAEDCGYYAAEGLQVEFKYGQVNDLLKVVSTGGIDFANVSGDEMVPAVAAGIPVRYIMTQYYRYPLAATSLAGPTAHLQTPAGLKSPKIGIPRPDWPPYNRVKTPLKGANLQER